MKHTFLFTFALLFAASALTNSFAGVISPDYDPEQSEDHYAIWRMDSTNEVNFVTYDLAAMEVHGHVKSITQNKTVCTFNEDGIMTSYKDESSDFMLDHNDDGCLTTYAVGAGSVTYSIDPERDRLVCFSGGEGASSWTHWYKYDDNNNLKEIEYNFEDEAEGQQESYTKRVTILMRDNHNNWTKRKIGDKIESRTITYYPNALGDETPEPAPATKAFNPKVGGYSFSGTIGGDKNAILTFCDGSGHYVISYATRICEVESYDKATGKLIIRGYAKKGAPILGRFNGTYKNGVYTGVFTNTKGGKVNFNLTLSK